MVKKKKRLQVLVNIWGPAQPFCKTQFQKLIQNGTWIILIITLHVIWLCVVCSSVKMTCRPLAYLMVVLWNGVIQLSIPGMCFHEFSVIHLTWYGNSFQGIPVTLLVLCWTLFTECANVTGFSRINTYHYSSVFATEHDSIGSISLLSWTIKLFTTSSVVLGFHSLQV